MKIVEECLNDWPFCERLFGCTSLKWPLNGKHDDQPWSFGAPYFTTNPSKGFSADWTAMWGPVAATEAKPRGLADIQVAFVCLLHAFCFFLLPFSLQTFYRPLVACLLARFILLPVLLLACCGTHTPLGPRDVRWRGRGGFSTAAANTSIPKTCCHWSADCTPPVDLSLLGDRQLPLHLCDAGWH